MKDFKGYKRIIAPVDGSESATKAVKKAIIFSKQFNLSLLSLYVLEESPVPKIMASVNQYETLKEELEIEGQKILNDVEELGKNQGIDVYTVLLRGSPDEKIINEAEENDLIIMGRHGRSAVDRVLIGSVSEKVLHHADSDVLIVK